MSPKVTPFGDILLSLLTPAVDARFMASGICPLAARFCYYREG
jgi:hypothetical protein